MEPTIAKELGKRAEPTEEEKRITKLLMERQESVALNGSHLSVDHGRLKIRIFYL